MDVAQEAGQGRQSPSLAVGNLARERFGAVPSEPDASASAAAFEVLEPETLVVSARERTERRTSRKGTDAFLRRVSRIFSFRLSSFWMCAE